MNTDKLFSWCAIIVLGFAAVGQLDVLQSSIWNAQARILYESRSSAWGSPRFFPSRGSTTRPHNVRKRFSDSP